MTKTENTDIIVKIAQLFYQNGSQLLITDEKAFLEQMAMEYAMGAGDKINMYSPYSEKRYVFTKAPIVGLIISDPEDIDWGNDYGGGEDDDDDSPESPSPSNGKKPTHKGIWPI